MEHTEINEIIVSSTRRKSNSFLNVFFGVSSVREIISLWPGTVLAVAVMLTALPLADSIGHWALRLQGLDSTGKGSPLSPVLLAIILGLLIRNLIPLPECVKPGIKFAVAKLLRLGIILIGIKLSLMDVIKLGAWGIPVVLVCITVGLFFVTWFARKLGVSERLGTLIAAGTSICGITAIVATAPAIDAEESEVAYAVANIALFGMIGMFVYPYLAHNLLQTSEQVGLFLGTAVHDTSQVVGAALTYKEMYNDSLAFKAATVTKLTRNLFLAAVVPLLAIYFAKQQVQEGGKDAKNVEIGKLFPLFVIGFVLASVVRSVGDATLQSGFAFGLFDAPTWKTIIKQLGDIWGSSLLGTAMAAVGLGTSISVFKGVGLKPLFVSFVAALVVGIMGFSMALLVGPYVHM